MWLKEFNKRIVRASTLAELLAVMVISSITLLVLTDGLSLFGRYAHLITNKVVRNAELWNSYCRLESLVTMADSLLATPSGKVNVYGKGAVGSLWVSDSMLLFMRGHINDTLFYSVVDMGISPIRDGLDSLFVILSISKERLRIVFAPGPRPRISTNELKDLEERYGYP